jgi:hypothetical protein
MRSPAQGEGGDHEAPAGGIEHQAHGFSLAGPPRCPPAPGHSRARPCVGPLGRPSASPARLGRISSAAAGQREAAIGQPFRTADIEYLDRVAHHLGAGLDLATARRRAATELAKERYVRDGDVWLKKPPTERVQR